MKTVAELCPFCEQEVEIPAVFKKLTCPNCLQPILPCAQCESQKCADCPLEKENLIIQVSDDPESYLMNKGQILLVLIGKNKAIIKGNEISKMFTEVNRLTLLKVVGEELEHTFNINNSTINGLFNVVALR